MSILPLHGRPAPTTFVKDKARDEYLTFRLLDLKTAPLSSRARRERRKRIWSAVLVVSMALLALVVAGWTVRIWLV